MGARQGVMGIKLDIIKDVCNLVIRQVQDLHPNLQMIFISHEISRFHEVVATSEYELSQHPAGKVAQTILEKNNNRDLSSFLGMAIHNEVKWLGLSSKDSILALFNLNIDEFDNPKDLRRAVYHLAWHAIDLLEVRQRPEYAAKFKAGPMIPKRSPMNLARLNLQADVFSAIMSGLQGEDDALDVLAKQRAMDSIAPVHERRAEDFPFVIAMEAAKYAYNELLELKPAKSKYMTYAYQTAIEVGRTFDDISIRKWWGFSEPAQNMSWRTIDAKTILGCAVYTSDDPFVRSIGHLVSDITLIEPLSGGLLGNTFNAYQHNEQHHVLHRELVEKAFEEAIAHGVREESGQPLIAAANAQNENLAEGNILGWCANALQAAARAFDSAMLTGISPQQAARMEFEGSKDSTSWDKLKKIGETIVDQKRKGFAVTMGSVAEICNSNPAFAPVLSSIRVTMKDPDYIKKLEAANDLSIKGPAPSAAPSGPKIQTPAPPAYTGPTFSAPAPGMGGSSNAAARHHAIMERMRAEKQKNGDGGEDRTK